MGRINKGTGGAVLLALLCALVFFSRTVYYYNLPEVSGVRPFRGFLNKIEIASGIADWAELDPVYAVLGGIVDAVFVSEGDTVEAGQPLFALRFEVEAAERKLREISNSIEKIKRDLEYTAAKLETISRALDETEDDGAAEAGGAENPEESRSDLVSLDLNSSRRALREAEFFYGLGAKSRADVETARNNLAALFLKYESEKTDLEFSLGAKNIDLQNLLLQEASCRDILEDYRAYGVIAAPAPGFVASLYVKKGMYVQDKTLAASIGRTGELSLECTVSRENNFIIPGDSCELSNSARVLEGIVYRVKPSAGGKVVSVRALSGELMPGETFDVIFEKSGAVPQTLVPNAALNQDNDGYFLNRIKRRRGILGEEYYVERLDVYVGDSDGANTVIIRGITFFEPVVLRSAGAVVSGGTVSLLNPGDFFE
jgi:multidrug efflux pump subunit AcrA (membrane-fusion protein)